jgi:hypothetical protein
MNRTLLNRLATLEAARRPVERKPVDERALMARITMTLAGGLAGLARRFGYRDEADLLHLALNDREDFCRRYAAVSPPCYSAHQVHPSKAKEYRDACDEAKAKEAGDVCTAVIQAFLEEEIVHGVLDVMFPHWLDHERPGLSPCRPCKPANYQPVEVDDEVLSDIGRSLLRLAARDKAREGRTPFAPANQGAP